MRKVDQSTRRGEGFIRFRLSTLADTLPSYFVRVSALCVTQKLSGLFSALSSMTVPAPLKTLSGSGILGLKLRKETTRSPYSPVPDLVIPKSPRTSLFVNRYRPSG